VSLLRDNLPHARLDFLTSREHAPLLQGFADVNGVLTLDRDAFRRRNPIPACLALLALIRRLRRARYQLVVDFQGYAETAWLTRLTGAAQRWGSVYRPGRAWAYTHAVPRNDRIHPAEWNRSLLVQCGLPPKTVRNRFSLPHDALAAARAFYERHALDPARPTLFIQPFTSSPQKNWPLAHYLDLARHWQQRQVQVMWGGGPADRPALASVEAAGLPVAAGSPLLLTAGLMQLASVVVGGDTGILHLAVALGKRVILLLSPSGGSDALPFEHPDWVVRSEGAGGVSQIPWLAVDAACQTAFREINAS
jgi:ADP-heptose:LPS heptosyltransferase